MTDQPLQSESRQAEGAEISPRGIGTFVKDFLDQAPRYINARAMVRALLMEHRLDLDIGIMGPAIRDGDSQPLLKLHSLTLASLAKAEWELHNYRKESLGFPYLGREQEASSSLNAEESRLLPWSDYRILLMFTLEAIQQSPHPVDFDFGAVESYKCRLRYRLAVALRVCCLLFKQECNTQGSPSVLEQLHILRTASMDHASSDFECKFHTHDDYRTPETDSPTLALTDD